LQVVQFAILAESRIRKNAFGKRIYHIVYKGKKIGRELLAAFNPRTPQSLKNDGSPEGKEGKEGKERKDTQGLTTVVLACLFLQEKAYFHHFFSIFLVLGCPELIEFRNSL
jgi:hypothetical protein